MFFSNYNVINAAVSDLICIFAYCFNTNESLQKTD